MVTPNLSVHKTHRQFFRHGILTLPLVYLSFFGLIGFRPGQVFYKIIGFIVNFMFLFNYGLAMAVMIAWLSSIEKEHFTDVNYGTIFKFYTGFVIFNVLKLTNLVYLSYKKCNIINLLDDITDIRENSLSIKELVFIILSFSGIFAMTLYAVYYFSTYVLNTFEYGTEFPLAFDNSGYVRARAMVILEYLVYFTLLYTCPMATGFLVTVIAVVLGREFDKCVENLREKVKEAGNLPADSFNETMERFQVLRNLVQRVDDMMFMDIALNITAAFGLLCFAVYTFYTTELEFIRESLVVPILVSIVTAVITLPSLAAINYKVH